ncbi:MAG: rRNA (guanine1516-N2)-methyltransferase [Pseudomonadota bacterium]|nr:rRNA (guanine1516-N2)-methyltransferase [Pseudomonadota bacterium]
MSHYLSFVPSCEDLAQKLIKQYGFFCDAQIMPRLHLNETGLFLLDRDHKELHIDWNDAQWKQRAKGGSGADPLIRATGAGQPLQILDLTAGWGKDGLLMAQAGAHVTLLERNPYMAALLQYAHERLEDKRLQSRIQVIYADAMAYLKALLPKDYPQVIYIDPMHPKREKSAKVKKHLQVLQALVPPNEDVSALITLAASKVLQQVVLKWPAKALPPVVSHHTYKGKTIRYEVYLPQK